VAKAETTAAITALLDAEAARGTPFTMDAERSTPPTGLIFRKPEAVYIS